MRGRGNDQGGRWPVGIWFAMVGVSAGTVASFSLIGWTFARDLYGGGDGAEPLDYEPQTVVIEADELPDPAGGAGGDGPVGPADPDPGAEPQIGISAAEPRAERLQDAEVEAFEPPEVPQDDPAPEASAPPQLVPVGEDECGRDEADEPDGPQWDGGWEEHWDCGWDSGHGRDDDDDDDDERDDDHGDRARGDYELPEIELDIEFDDSSIDLELELESASPAAADDPESAPDLASDHESGPAPGTEN
ncbi:hypothetical protein [Glycomyces sp. NPDC021274]|uniref:hypothetical protein n=1 Tax=Glycomyces sp. NPDC021274 TaxID=3155120 RepID=UPI0033D35A50